MAWRTLEGTRPEIIAHRGASGLRPEHSLAGYALALAQGADVIEPDLVPSRDGVLHCRHEPWLDGSTDIAARQAFAGRRRVLTAAEAAATGAPAEAWWTIDLDAAEIAQLRVRQAFPGRGADHDGGEPPPSFRAMLDWAAAAAAARGVPVRLYPELKHPAALAAAGLDPVPLFLRELATLPPGVGIRVQCFETAPLKRIHEALGLPCVRLLEDGEDWRAVIASDGDWLAGLGPSKRLLVDAQGRDSGLVAAAHDADLRVDAYTFRDDAVAPGFASIADELRAAIVLGLDGLFCDFPGTAVAVRDALGEGEGARG